MTFRTQILAGLIAAIAAPAITLASSSGPTIHDLQSAPILWSYRTSAAKTTADVKNETTTLPRCCNRQDHSSMDSHQEHASATVARANTALADRVDR